MTNYTVKCVPNHIELFQKYSLKQLAKYEYVEGRFNVNINSHLKRISQEKILTTKSAIYLLLQMLKIDEHGMDTEHESCSYNARTTKHKTWARTWIWLSE